MKDTIPLKRKGNNDSAKDARCIIAAAAKKAEAIGQPINVAVVHKGGNLIAFERIANAGMGSIDIAQKRGWAVRAFDIAAKDLGANSKSETNSSKFALPITTSHCWRNPLKRWQDRRCRRHFRRQRLAGS
jgi:hypothetical protein